MARIRFSITSWSGCIFLWNLYDFLYTAIDKIPSFSTLIFITLKLDALLLSILINVDERGFNGTQIETIWKYLQKLSKSIQKIPSLLPLGSNSGIAFLAESVHFADLSLQSPFHSPSPNGFLIFIIFTLSSPIFLSKADIREKEWFSIKPTLLKPGVPSLIEQVIIQLYWSAPTIFSQSDFLFSLAISIGIVVKGVKASKTSLG